MSIDADYPSRFPFQFREALRTEPHRLIGVGGGRAGAGGPERFLPPAPRGEVAEAGVARPSFR